MSTGLQTTFELLTQTPNEAAVGALIPALDSPHQAVQEGALRAILRRRSPAGKRELLRRFDRLGQQWQHMLGEFRGRMTAALRDAVLGTDSQMVKNGCQAIIWFGEYDLMPALLNAAEDATDMNADRAAATVLELAEQLYLELATPRDYRNRRDPQIARQHVTSSLEFSLRRYAQHKRPEVVEAALMLMNRDNVTLKQILNNPHDGAYLCVLETLRGSQRAGVIRLLLSYLDDPQAPSAALVVLANRADARFLKYLLRKIGHEPSTVAVQNLKRVSEIAWLSGDLRNLDQLDDQGQHAAVQVACASGMRRLEAYQVVAHLLEHGKVGGRRAAAAALAAFKGADANQLAMRGLDDPDPRVQAKLLLQLRQRSIPGALNHLLRMADSPHEVVRSAVRESLSEFSFERFVASFDLLTEELRRTTGALVKKLDPQAVPALAAEMAQRSRTRRLRAIEICEALDAASELEEPLTDLLSCEDHIIRAAAAQALGQSQSLTAWQALNQALDDRSVTVQGIAEESLRSIAQRGGPLHQEHTR